MTNTLYREEILEHWRSPQNWGGLNHPNFVIDDNNPLCGDSIHLEGIISDGKIYDLKFRGEGCVISRAASSIFTQYVKNKKVNEIQNLSQAGFLSLIEIPLVPARLNCALLVYFALQKALKQVE